MSAIYGAQTFIMYAYSGSLPSSQWLCGDLMYDTQGVISAVNDMQNIIAGNILSNAILSQTGQIQVTVNGSTIYTI